MPEIMLTLCHPEGLHARPAALFVKTAQQFEADIQVSVSKWKANAKSILEVLTLGATEGTSILIQANGENADQALVVLEKLVKDNFGDLIGADQ